ncbi:hypothetical protein AB0M19_32665 [Streptomyces sp. NPDC051920]|uniref:hypothetical protein n=1 Tax=Streptomyces sp. NPDC051920 TaxID=3155523 RepID=UPI003423F837
MGIYLFRDMFKSSNLPDDEGELLWSSVQSRSTIGHVVIGAAQDVLQLHGADGYLKKWVQHPFPVAELRELRRLHLERDACDLPHELSPQE